MFGFWFAKYLQRLLVKILKKSNLEPTFIKFIGNVSYYLLLLILVVLFLSQLGIETDSLIALLGTTSIAVGLALQGCLSNLAAWLFFGISVSGIALKLPVKWELLNPLKS